MPKWAIIYVVLVVGISLVGLFWRDETQNLRDDVGNFISHTVLLLPFFGYWAPNVLRSIGIIFPIVTLAALLWEFISTPAALRRLWCDSNFSERERLGMTAVGTLFMVPLYATAAIGLSRFFE